MLLFFGYMRNLNNYCVKNKMRIHFLNMLLFLGLKRGNDQEVEFHEIEIHFYRISNYFLIMRSNYFASFHEVEISNNDLIS